MAFLGHLGPLWPLWPVRHIAWANKAPFGLNQQGQRGKPTSPQGQVGPKPQLRPPETFLTPNPIKTLRTHFVQGPQWTTFQPMASGIHQRPQDKLISILPLNLRGILPFPPCTPHSRLQEWCIYGIIYHCAPFLLSNSMVMLSGPNAIIPNQGPKIQHPFRRRTLQLISLAFHGGYQRTIQGPQSPGPAGVGLAVQFRIIQKGTFLRGITSFQSVVKAASTSASLGKFNWSIQVILMYPVWPWPNWVNSFPLWQFSPTVQFPRWLELYFPNSDNTAGDSPSRISLSAFHIYWPPFSTWGLFPQLINILDLFLSLCLFSFMKLIGDSRGWLSYLSGHWLHLIFLIFDIPVLILTLILLKKIHSALCLLSFWSLPKSQARTQAVLTPTPRDSLDSTPAVPQLRAQLDRGPIMEGASPFRKEGRGPRRSSSFSGLVGKFPGLSRTSLKVPG
ncbi:hypothetical protein O181_059888 [Austropuccinia psidii MF-1]|uniref:Uncharacterized protein n=1 Tax=Austropuccinia psidii MF-1 TaxID=1389203 RepID=A0A9Q3EFK5_9BASI|nr:hypothetical protein [Austropuccinia psidii MF-1]